MFYWYHGSCKFYFINFFFFLIFQALLQFFRTTNFPEKCSKITHIFFWNGKLKGNNVSKSFEVEIWLFTDTTPFHCYTFPYQSIFLSFISGTIFSSYLYFAQNSSRIKLVRFWKKFSVDNWVKWNNKENHTLLLYTMILHVLQDFT